jgi:hypothetical protein
MGLEIESLTLIIYIILLSVLKSRMLRKVFGPKRGEYLEVGENYITRKYYSGNHIKCNEVGGICGTYMGEGEVHTGFS